MVKVPKAAILRVLTLPLLLLAAGCGPTDGGASAGGRAGVVRDCPDCPELVMIQPGSFDMGATAAETKAAGLDAARATAEQPVHKVALKQAFAIGRYELSISEFAVYADATGFQGKGCWTLEAGAWKMQPDADWRNPGFAVTPASPAVCLSWDDYQGYLGWLSKRTGRTYRLPSEAEWEYVAQLAELGPRIRTAQSADGCKALNGADQSLKTKLDVKWAHFLCDDGHVLAAPIGSYGSDKLGLFDVFGNVSEFTADCYFPDHAGAPNDGSARLEDKCSAVTLKGGSWAGEPGFFRPAFRVTGTKDVHGTGFGVRVLREEPKKQ